MRKNTQAKLPVLPSAESYFNHIAATTSDAVIETMKANQLKGHWGLVHRAISLFITSLSIPDINPLNRTAFLVAVLKCASGTTDAAANNFAQTAHQLISEHLGGIFHAAGASLPSGSAPLENTELTSKLQ